MPQLTINGTVLNLAVGGWGTPHVNPDTILPVPEKSIDQMTQAEKTELIDRINQKIIDSTTQPGMAETQEAHQRRIDAEFKARLKMLEDERKRLQNIGGANATLAIEDLQKLLKRSGPPQAPPVKIPTGGNPVETPPDISGGLHMFPLPGAHISGTSVEYSFVEDPSGREPFLIQVKTTTSGFKLKTLGLEPIPLPIPQIAEEETAQIPWTEAVEKLPEPVIIKLSLKLLSGAGKPLDFETPQQMADVAFRYANDADFRNILKGAVPSALPESPSVSGTIPAAPTATVTNPHDC